MYKGSVRGHLQESVSWPPSYCTVYSLSVHLDLHHLDADPDPDSTYHPDVDPDADSDFYLMKIWMWIWIFFKCRCGFHFSP